MLPVGVVCHRRNVKIEKAALRPRRGPWAHSPRAGSGDEKKGIKMNRGSVTPRTRFLLATAALAFMALVLIPSQAQDSDDPPPQAGRLSIVNGNVPLHTR